MADQGASKARTNEIPFVRSSSFQGADRLAREHPADLQSSNFQGHDAGRSVSTREAAVGANTGGADRAGVTRSNAMVPRSKKDGLVRTYILRRFLGWDGSTPVYWTSATDTPPQPGLTNITVEDEFVVSVSVGGFSRTQPRKLLR